MTVLANNTNNGYNNIFVIKRPPKAGSVEPQYLKCETVRKKMCSPSCPTNFRTKDGLVMSLFIGKSLWSLSWEWGCQLPASQPLFNTFDTFQTGIAHL